MHTACEEIECDPDQSLDFQPPRRFKLGDQDLVRSFVDRFFPLSCEYNFSNLFCWQDVYDYSWFIFQGRLVVYDGVNHCAFMPLGPELQPPAMADLSRRLIRMGREPNIGIVQKTYLDTHPDIEKFYTPQEERDHAEYLYRVESLAELNGIKLHKKRNLISQFNRTYPDFSILPLKGTEIDAAWEFARNLLESRKKPPQNLIDEFCALEKAFVYFDDLGFEGLVLKVKDELVAFSLFSRLNGETYNVQFEKANLSFKGAAQVINQETARYLEGKCLYVNREQDLGIRGLRKAKLSYEPERLIIPYTLKFNADS